MLYQNALVLAVCVLLYGLIAGRVARSWVSGPMVFVAAGLVLGPSGLDLLRLAVTAEGLRTLAELTLAMVLFGDAAKADLAVVRRSIGLPERLLLVGLPLTIVLGVAACALLLPGLGWLEMALLATTLAPTDAALGKPVVANPAVPARLREALNLESGLNDGICVPILVILLGLAVGTQVEGGSLGHMAGIVAEEIGIGLVVGLALTGSVLAALRVAERRAWSGESWGEVPMIALAAGCFAGAQAAGGSGFIACFVGGLLVSARPPAAKHARLRGADAAGETLALLTWVVFGADAVGQVLSRIGWAAIAYAVLSLTVIRMLPVYLALSGSGLDRRERLFLGWFGPRGLASIVFAILILDAGLPGNTVIVPAVACTILLSVVLHGLTATPLAALLAAAAPAPAALSRQPLDTGAARR